MDRLISEKQCQQLMDLASVSVSSSKFILLVLFCFVEFVLLCGFLHFMHMYAHSHIHTCTHSHIHTYTHSHIHTCTHSHPHTQYGSEGDGYSRKSPHTSREKFEGLNILDAAKVPTLRDTHFYKQLKLKDMKMWLRIRSLKMWLRIRSLKMFH